MDTRIHNILQHFDFDKVHQVMSNLDWRWAGKDGYKVPSISRMVVLAASLLDELLDDATKTRVGTGGFYAERLEDNLRLYFCLEEWDCNSNEDEE